MSYQDRRNKEIDTDKELFKDMALQIEELETMLSLSNNNHLTDLKQVTVKDIRIKEMD